LSDSRILKGKLLHGQERLEIGLVHLDHEPLEQEVVSGRQVIMSVILDRLDQAFRTKTQLVLELFHNLHVDIVEITSGTETLTLRLMQIVPRMLANVIDANSLFGVCDKDLSNEVLSIIRHEFWESIFCIQNLFVKV
jgi:hypothetical protein